jgi:hypothetical protein
VTDSFHDISPLAAQRADTMLPALQAELARGVRRKRTRTRAASACLVTLLLGGAIVAATLPARRTPPVPAPVPLAEAPSSPVKPSTTIEIVRSMDAPLIEIVRDSPRDAILAIYASPSVDLASILVTDRELLDLLDEIGRPSGLVRANGKVWLTAAVTDDEIARRRGR